MHLDGFIHHLLIHTRHSTHPPQQGGPGAKPSPRLEPVPRGHAGRCPAHYTTTTTYRRPTHLMMLLPADSIIRTRPLPCVCLYIHTTHIFCIYIYTLDPTRLEHKLQDDWKLLNITINKKKGVVERGRKGLWYGIVGMERERVRKRRGERGKEVSSLIKQYT